jgi:hypothetical protein
MEAFGYSYRQQSSRASSSRGQWTQEKLGSSWEKDNFQRQPRFPQEAECKYKKIINIPDSATVATLSE